MSTQATSHGQGAAYVLPLSCSGMIRTLIRDAFFFGMHSSPTNKGKGKDAAGDISMESQTTEGEEEEDSEEEVCCVYL